MDDRLQEALQTVKQIALANPDIVTMWCVQLLVIYNSCGITDAETVDTLNKRILGYLFDLKEEEEKTRG